MKKAKLVLPLIFLSVIACGLIQSPTAVPSLQPDQLSTIIAQTMQAMTTATPLATNEVLSTATSAMQPSPTVTGNTPSPIPPTVTAPANVVSVSMAGKSFSIPTGVATGATLDSLPANQGSNLPIWEIYPAHDEFKLDAYVLQNKFFIPKIIIYPKQDFSSMNEGAAQIINDLQAILANQNAPLPDVLPFLPLFNAGQVFHSNEKFLSFQNGNGIRFLTQFSQAPDPVNNHEMFYTFQGLTNDGAYYVAAILPVNAAFLVENSEPETATPPDGVPFDWNNFDALPNYFAAIKQKLNATDPNAFTPALSSLDQMIQSLSVTANQ